MKRTICLFIASGGAQRVMRRKARTLISVDLRRFPYAPTANTIRFATEVPGVEEVQCDELSPVAVLTKRSLPDGSAKAATDVIKG